MNQKYVSEFSTFGSCSSRNIFNSDINKNYKLFFKINHSVEAVSLISLMSNPIPYDTNLINSNSNYDNVCVTEDLSKSFLDFIKSDYVDYLMIDTYCDVTSNVIIYDEKEFITQTGRLKNTEFYNLLKDKRRINIFNNFDEYYELWVDACNRFFKFFEKNCNNTKIILNCSRSVYKYLDSQYNHSENESFKIEKKYNKYRNLLDKYILDNFDVEILPFDNNTFAFQNHIFGLHPTHYEPKYYVEKNKQLLDIIHRNNKLNYNNDKNSNFRKIQREKLIESFDLPNEKTNNFLFNEILNFKKEVALIKPKIIDRLNKYNTARIDIKNYGKNELNNVKIFNISDSTPNYHYPKWFKDSQGSGIVIQSKSNFLKFEIECIGDGELTIILRGIDVKNNGKRIPIYVEYTNFSIDNKKVFNENKIVSHDDAYIYKTKVIDSQKCSIYLEWLPF